MKSVKLTPQLLRQIIEEEVSKSFGEMEDVEKRAKDTKEKDADEFADSLEHKVDSAKAYGVEEARLIKRIGLIRQKRAALVKEIKAAKAKRA